MIVISGALVLVALVLLIIGVVGPDLTFVYASIAVSLVSLVFLVVGILQRRGESTPAAETAPAPQVTPADEVTAVVPSQEARASMRKVVQEPPAADTADAELETGGTVLVVEGRPRYHVEGCRYLSGKAAEAVDVLDAREEGFSPCGVCKPDDALAAAAQAEPVEEQLDEPATEALVIDEPAAEEVDEEPVAEPAPAAKRASTRKAPTRKAPARKAPAKAAATKAVKAPAAKALGRAAVKAAPAAKAAPVKAATKAAAPARAGSVVVIPDRGKFHKAQCRFVRDVDGTEVMSKTAASRAGYAACGVCKP